MKIRSVLLTLIILSCTITTVAGQSSTPGESTLAYLQKFRTDYINSMLDGKPAIIQTYFADDIRLMPEFQRTIMNKNNTVQYWQQFINRFDIEACTRMEIEVLDLGARVMEIGSCSMKMKLKRDGRSFELKGKYLDLWEKKGEQLLLLTQAWNYNHAVNFSDLLKFTEVPSVMVAYEAHLPVNNPVRFELAALNRLMETVISQRDGGIWKQFYTDDAIWLYTGNPVVQGRKTLDEFFDIHVKELPIFEKLDVRNDRVDDLGKYVIEYASHIAIIRNGDFSGVFTGKDLAIWRREPNGSLKIFRHIGMYD